MSTRLREQRETDPIERALIAFRNGVQDAGREILLGGGSPRKQENAFRQQVYRLYKVCLETVQAEVQKIEGDDDPPSREGMP